MRESMATAVPGTRTSAVQYEDDYRPRRKKDTRTHAEKHGGVIKYGNRAYGRSELYSRPPLKSTEEQEKSEEV